MRLIEYTPLFPPLKHAGFVISCFNGSYSVTSGRNVQPRILVIIPNVACTSDRTDDCFDVFVPSPGFFSLNTRRSFAFCLRPKVAVVVFAIPTGIFGNGFEEMIMHRKQQKEQQLLEDIIVQESGDVATADESGAGFAFLDTNRSAGKVYSTLLVVVVLVDMMAFFTSTLNYLQVRYNRCTRLACKVRRGGIGDE